MQIPSDYLPGYEKARAIDPDRADNYIAHTLIGDPKADAATKYLASLEQEESARLTGIILESRDESGLPDDSPEVIRDFVRSCDAKPDWVDFSAFTPGRRMFYRNSSVTLAAMLGGVLVEGFSTNISKSFFITGRLRDQGIRRLKQNNRHMVEIFLPGGLERGGDGQVLSLRLRLIHSQIRNLLNVSSDWDYEAWGTPISAAHLGLAISAFSARLLKHMRSLGASFNDEERASFMAVWRYTGYLMGIPETILFRDEADALDIFKIGGLCEPPPDAESIVMAHSLVNSAPLVAGETDEAARKNLTRYVFRVSRALIGNVLAEQLKYPPASTFGVLAGFRMQQRYDRLLGRFTGKRSWNHRRLFTILNVSMFDEEGIGYTLPDHVYSEESRRW